ncbi:MAG: S8 family serine peptidase [Thermoanaerobaculia bacterium]|nr:S8 family serine peptidase [Thermoanaerobaculia bacterium]
MRPALFAVLVLASPLVWADSSATRCAEVELQLAGQQTVSRLEGCGEEYPDDLLWHLDRIDQIDGALDGSYDRNESGSGAVVYVMDTGVRADHLEFEGENGTRVIAGIDTSGAVAIGRSSCRSSNRSLAPCYGSPDELASASHGTAVASIVAGRTTGVAPGAWIVSVRVMNERGLATTRSYLAALDLMIRHAWSTDAPPFRTAVVNISGWMLERISGGYDDMPVVPYTTVEAKIRTMIGGVGPDGKSDPEGKRFLFVVAGNNRDSGCGASGLVDRFPAVLGYRTDGLITVGGMTPDNAWWNGGCRGGIEVLAPAEQIFSATITGRDHYRGRRFRSGTSFAAPIIAGIATRLLGAHPDLTPVELEALITSTPSRIANPSAAFADGKVATLGLRVTSDR